MPHHDERRSFAVGCLRFVLRGLEIVLLSFAAIGPRPPPPPLRAPDPTEQVQEVRPRGHKRH